VRKNNKVFGKHQVVVVGSLHMDLILKVKSIPHIGETVLGKNFKMSPGGKGANQAIAATKLGEKVKIVGRVGADMFGKQLIENARKNGVDVKHIVIDKKRFTGLALIMVDGKGNNIITVASGADMGCCEEDINGARETIVRSDVLLTQLEIPLSTVEHAIMIASESGVKTILNPSPVQKLPNRLLKKIDVLVLNEREAEILSGVKMKNINLAGKASRKILGKVVKNVIITLGEDGAIISTAKETVHIKGIRVNAVDTTGTGDAFCGALAVSLSRGKGLKEATWYANYAGALAATKIGAQEALPTKMDVERFMKKHSSTGR